MFTWLSLQGRCILHVCSPGNPDATTRRCVFLQKIKLGSLGQTSGEVFSLWKTRWTYDEVVAQPRTEPGSAGSSLSRLGMLKYNYVLG